MFIVRYERPWNSGGAAERLLSLGRRCIALRTVLNPVAGLAALVTAVVGGNFAHLCLATNPLIANKIVGDGWGNKIISFLASHRGSKYNNSLGGIVVHRALHYHGRNLVLLRAVHARQVDVDLFHVRLSLCICIRLLLRIPLLLRLVGQRDPGDGQRGVFRDERRLLRIF